MTGPDDNSDMAPVRQFDRKKRPPQDFISTLRSSGGFLIVVGLQLLAVGMISVIPFHNKFGRLMILLGFVLAFAGFAVKMLDICIKIVRGRS